MADQTQGIDQLEKVVDFAADLGSVIEKVMDEKGGAIARVTHLLGLSTDLISMASLDVAKLKAQFKALDDAEKATLMAEFKQKFQLEHKDAEAKVEAALDLLEEGVAFTEKAVGFVKSLSAQPAPQPPAAA